MKRVKLTSITIVTAIAIAAVAFFTQQEGAAPPPTADVAQSPMIDVTLPAEFSAEATMGKRGFDAKCAACHGNNAAGTDGTAPPLVHKIYEPSHHGDESFQIAVARGVRAHHWTFGDMAPVEGLTRADVTAIIAYVRELQRANGIN